MRVLVLTGITIALISSTALPQGLVESSDGAFGTFLVGGGQQLSLNFADKSMRLSVVRRTSSSQIAWGGHLKAKANDGLLTIFEDSLRSIEWSGEAYAIWIIRDSPRSATFTTLTGTVGFQHGTEAVVDTAMTITRHSKTLDGLSGKVALTSFGAIGRGSYLIGLAAAYGPRSNYSSLKEYQVCTDLTIQASSSVRSCSSARLADDYQKSDETSLMVDLVVWPFPSAPIAGIAYGRHNTPNAIDRFVPAIGVLFGQKGAPLSVSGSLALEFGEVQRLTARVGFPLGL